MKLYKKTCLGAALFLLLSASLPFKALAEEGWAERVEITAHRGDSSVAPENTLMAFQEAIESGADRIELDANETADGTLVVFHDEDLKRMTGRDGKIWEVTFEELKGFSLAGSLGPAYRDASVPTLGEALEFCRGKIRLNIEIKQHERQSPELVGRVVELIRELHMEEECMITSFCYDNLVKAKAAAPELATGFITTEEVTDLAAYPAADRFMLSMELVKPETVEAIHSAEKKAAAWTVNDQYSVEKCKEAGIDDLITDRPQDILADY